MSSSADMSGNGSFDDPLGVFSVAVAEASADAPTDAGADAGQDAVAEPAQSVSANPGGVGGAPRAFFFEIHVCVIFVPRTRKYPRVRPPTHAREFQSHLLPGEKSFTLLDEDVEVGSSITMELHHPPCTVDCSMPL